MERGAGRCGGGVNDVREFPLGETEIPNISRMKLNCRVSCEVRHILLERIVIPCQDMGRRAKIEFIIRPRETLQKPTAEKTRAAGNE